MPLGGYAPLPIRLGGSATHGWSPEAQARAAADLVAIKRTVPLFKITFTSAHPTGPTIHALHSGHGVGSAYFPDDQIANGVGDTSMRWSARRWSDAYEISHPFIFRHAEACLHGATAGFATVQCDVWGIRVRSFTAAGAAVNAKVSVWVY